jgi:hypothetical protein
MAQYPAWSGRRRFMRDKIHRLDQLIHRTARSKRWNVFLTMRLARSSTEKTKAPDSKELV